MPSHSHSMSTSGTDGIVAHVNNANEGANFKFNNGSTHWFKYGGLKSVGKNDAHNNVMPFICTYFWRRIN